MGEGSLHTLLQIKSDSLNIHFLLNHEEERNLTDVLLDNKFYRLERKAVLFQGGEGTIRLPRSICCFPLVIPATQVSG